MEYALWITLPVLLVCSGIASGSETAFFSLSGEDRAILARSRRGRVALRLIDSPRVLLIEILTLNMTINVLYFVVSTLLVYRAESGAMAAAVSVGSVFAIILFGEVLAKVLSGSRARQVAGSVAEPLFIVQKVGAPIFVPLDRFVITPLTRLVNPSGSSGGLDSEDLGTLLERAGSVLSDTERGLLSEILDLRIRRAMDILTPRVDLVTVHEDWTVNEIRSIGRAYVPIVRESLDGGVIGTVDAIRALNSGPGGQVVIDPVFVPETATLDSVFAELARKGVDIGYCVDERGAIAGMVTLDDIVDELTAESVSGSTEEIREMAPGHWRVSGRLGMQDFLEQFERKGDEPIWDQSSRVSTIGGFVSSCLGRIAQPGDEVLAGPYRLRVVRVDKRAVSQVDVVREDGQS